MNDDDLDLLLEDTRPDVGERARTLARRLATETVRGRARRRRWLRTGVLVPVGVGLVTLTGAGTYAAYQLSIPPFVGLEEGTRRVEDPIPVGYTTDAGRALDCRIWLEFRNATPAQRDQLDALSSDPEWDGVGQRVYDALPAEHRAAQDGPEPLWSERIDKAVYAAALDQVPGLSFRAGDGSPSLEGSTTRCDYPGGTR